MSTISKARFRAAIVALAPAVLLAGFVYHPYIATPDEAEVAAAAAADTTRWGLSHLAIGVGYALVALAFLAVRRNLRVAGEERWSVLALPFIVVGSTLFAILPGMEFAPLAAAETGGDVEAAQAALLPWFLPILLTGAVCFALGAFGFARDRRQQSSESGADPARRRGTDRDGARALRPPRCGTVRGRCGRRRLTVAAGLCDVAAAGGATGRTATAATRDLIVADRWDDQAERST